MENQDKPTGGVRMTMGFGAQTQTPPALDGADIPFRLVVVGDLGGAGDGRIRDVSGEDVASLMASFGAVAALEVPNHLGSTPPALSIRLPLAALRDLDPRTLAARIPETAKVERLAASGDVAALAGDPSLDRVAAALERPAPIAPRPAATLPVEDEEGLDRLLGMIDLPSNTPQPAPAEAAISAFLASTTTPRKPATAPQAGVSAVVEEQVRAVAEHPTWRSLEAAWRSLRLIFTARGGRTASRLLVCDAKHKAIPDLLNSDAFADRIADESGMTAILVLGAFDSTPRDLDALDRIAGAADALGVPVIVSLSPDFLGVAPERVAAMHTPGTLLESPAYAAWRGLRSRDESRSLFAAWNDVLLRPADSLAPAAWGEPGVVLAAQVLRSLARTGWPTEITGPETGLDGLDVSEMDLPGGRRAAIPTRAPVEMGVARALSAEGITALMCRLDRDSAWFTRASAVYGVGAMKEEDAKVFDTFNALPFRFISAAVEDALQRNRSLYEGRPHEEAAAAMSSLLNDMLIASGPGARARVTAVDAAARQFEVHVRLGALVMGGFDFSFEVAL